MKKNKAEERIRKHYGAGRLFYVARRRKEKENSLFLIL